MGRLLPVPFALLRFSAFSLTRLKKSRVRNMFVDVRTITTSRVSNMFNTYMQSLFNISVSNNLLHQHTDCTFRDVEHDTCLSMVVFVWQSLLLSRVTHNINDVSNFVCFKLNTLAITELFKMIHKLTI
jgi:hypothetical protein